MGYFHAKKRAIDFSHENTPYRWFLKKILKIFHQKTQKYGFFGSPLYNLFPNIIKLLKFRKKSIMASWKIRRRLSFRRLNGGTRLNPRWRNWFKKWKICSAQSLFLFKCDPERFLTLYSWFLKIYYYTIFFLFVIFI
jgi:hypothetical protein